MRTAMRNPLTDYELNRKYPRGEVAPRERPSALTTIWQLESLKARNRRRCTSRGTHRLNPIVQVCVAYLNLNALGDRSPPLL